MSTEKLVKSPVSMAQLLSRESTSTFLAQQLGEKKMQFVSNLIALTEADSLLQKCDPARVMKCALNATALDLPLNKSLGFAYVIPYNQKGVNGNYETVPQFQIGYKGYIQLAIRSGHYRNINATPVREGEVSRNIVTGEVKFLGENPEGKVIGYLAYMRLNNGFEQSKLMTTDEVLKHAQRYSKSFAKYGSGLWKDDFEKMALKTVLKSLLSNYGILSVDMQNAIVNDQTDDNGNYIDNEKAVIKEIIEQEEKVETINIDDV